MWIARSLRSVCQMYPRSGKAKFRCNIAPQPTQRNHFLSPTQMGSHPVLERLVVERLRSSCQYLSPSKLSARLHCESTLLEDIYLHHRLVNYDPQCELSRILGPSASRRLASHTTDRTNTRQHCNVQLMDPVARECSASSSFQGEEGQDDGAVAFGPAKHHLR